jgi:hypothetical protein
MMDGKWNGMGNGQWKWGELTMEIWNRNASFLLVNMTAFFSNSYHMFYRFRVRLGTTAFSNNCLWQ